MVKGLSMLSMSTLICLFFLTFSLNLSYFSVVGFGINSHVKPKPRSIIKSSIELACSEPCLTDRRSLIQSFTASSFLLSPESAVAISDTPLSSIILPGSTKPFPLASFGLQIYSDEVAYKLTLLALEAGFRNFFASVLANNQRGFARAIRDSGISRQDLFICGTVLSNRAQGENNAYRKTRLGCEENIMAFSTGNIDYLDMIMLDYPGPDGDSIRGQWRALEEMKRDGLAECLAVSNFSPEQLDSIYIYKDATTQPTVNQLPYSIANHPKKLIEYNRDRGIFVQSWSPLSTTLPKYKAQLEAIGKRYGKTAAQVALRWIVQTGASYCMQSKNQKHLEEGLDVFDFSLTDREIRVLSELQPPPLLSM